jgi:ribosome-binding factor A
MTTRQEKVKELLKAEISDILRREMKDPRLGFVTVTDAEVTADMRQAKIFVSVLGTEEEQKNTMKGLKSAEGFVRSEFAKRARMKTIPEIQFRFDESIEHGIRIFELLEQIKKEENEGESA